MRQPALLLSLLMTCPLLAQGASAFPEVNYTHQWVMGMQPFLESEKTATAPVEIRSGTLLSGDRKTVGKVNYSLQYVFRYGGLQAVGWVRSYALSELNRIDKDYDRTLAALTKSLGKPETSEDRFYKNGPIGVDRVEKPDPQEFPKTKWAETIFKGRLVRFARWKAKNEIRILQASVTKAGKPVLVMVYAPNRDTDTSANLSYLIAEGQRDGLGR